MHLVVIRQESGKPKSQPAKLIFAQVDLFSGPDNKKSEVTEENVFILCFPLYGRNGRLVHLYNINRLSKQVANIILIKVIHNEYAVLST